MTLDDAVGQIESGELSSEALELLMDESRWDELFGLLERRRTPSTKLAAFWNRLCELHTGKAWSFFGHALARDLLELSEFAFWRFRPGTVARLKPERWSAAPARLRRAAIYQLFEDFPGEPFATLGTGGWDRKLHVDRYIPHPKILELREMVLSSGDQDSLDLIDRLLNERSSAHS